MPHIDIRFKTIFKFYSYILNILRRPVKISLCGLNIGCKCFASPFLKNSSGAHGQACMFLGVYIEINEDADIDIVTG
jgi:hypothetical protein